MPMSPRLLRPRQGGDPDALRYIAAVQAADGQPLESGVRKAINDFVVGCKADGIWSAIKASCILAGARTLAGALTPLAGTAPTNFNFVSGDYNRKTGLVGNASTKYLNANRASNADPQNSYHACVYGSSLDGGAGASIPVWMGSSSTGIKNVGLFNYALGGVPSYFFNARRAEASNDLWQASLASSGFVGVSRPGSSSVVGRAKGTNNTFTTASLAPSSEATAVFAGFTNGAAGGYSAARLAFYSIGESLTLSLLDGRVSTLYTAIGAAIP